MTISEQFLSKAKGMLARAKARCNQSTFVNTERQKVKYDAVMQEAMTRQDPHDPSINAVKAQRILNYYSDINQVIQDFRDNFLERKVVESREVVRKELPIADSSQIPSEAFGPLREYVA
ncbi:MAG: hypothetical protein LQ343_000695 [Gyalolechia ehrenbergii]|nr:MAG: hypothetical protein LQ343_000695 [Gyalolechia ehrenbergii]